MARTQRRRVNKTANALLKSSRGASLLHELMRELAFVLLTQGITPKSFGDLSRVAFVEAAATHSRLLNGRINQSRVAAQTGLSRADVKRLLARKRDDIQMSQRPTPVGRVIEGWRTDATFLNSKRAPQALSIRKFSRLTKKYAGDVPYRAVLGELERIGAVETTGDQLHLTRAADLRRRDDFAALAQVVPALLDGLRIASATGADTGKSIYRLQIPARSEFELAFLRDRCSTSARSMLEGLGHSLRVSPKKSRSKCKASAVFSVSILLTENRLSNRESEGPRARRKPQDGR
jgi:hypothetical protein